MQRGASLIGILWFVSQAASAGSLAEQITAASQKNFAEYIELLSIPNVADEPRDIQRNAAFLLASMKDDEGRVLVPGYYDGITLTPADREILKAR